MHRVLPYRLLPAWICIVLLLTPACITLCAQPLSGLWVGRIMTADSTLAYELFVRETPKGLEAHGQTTFLVDGIENIGVKRVELRKRGERWLLEDHELVYDNYTTPPKRVKLYGDLMLREEGGARWLVGSFYTRVQDIKARSVGFERGTIRLRRLDSTDMGRLPARVEALSARQKPPAPPRTRPQREPQAGRRVPPGPEATARGSAAARTGSAVSGDRVTEIIRTVELSGDSVTVILYDNGEVDGDTVNVYLNDRLWLREIGLSARAVQHQLDLRELMGDSVLLILSPTNLGAIPPNTGLLILLDGDRRYDIGFSGDLSRNPAILLRRMKNLREP